MAVKEKKVEKKGVIVFVLAVMVAGGIFAQTQGFQLGARFVGVIPTYNLSSGISTLIDEDAPGGTSGLAPVEGEFIPSFAIQAAYNFSETAGIQVEFLFSQNKWTWDGGPFNVTAETPATISVPILLRVGTTIGDGVQLTGIGGIYFTIPSPLEIKTSFSLNTGGYSVDEDITYSGLLTGSAGAMIGGIIGFKVGPGVLFADVRYGFDFSESSYSEISGENDYDDSDYSISAELKLWKKSSFQIGLGYTFSFGGNK